MSQHPFLPQADSLTRISREALSSADETSFIDAAETCVLTRLQTLRIFGGLPLQKHPLSEEERLNRLKALLSYWANGCPFVIDEQLFADVANRRRRV